MKKIVVKLHKQGAGLKGRSQLVELSPEEVSQKLAEEQEWEAGRAMREALAGRKAELPTDKEKQDALWERIVNNNLAPSVALEARIQQVMNKYPLPKDSGNDAG